MTEPNITQEKLKQEIENGKTFEEIAHEYGYGQFSRALARKYRKLGYRQNESLNKRDQYGGTQEYIKKDLIDAAIQAAGLEDTENIHIIKKQENNKIVFEFTDKMWRKKRSNE